MPRLEPRLNNSDDVSSQAARGTGHSNIPETKIYIPNYQGVNQLLTEAGGGAVISFGDALARQSMRTMQEYRAVDNKIEAANAMIDARANTDRDAKAFLEENVSGEGYMEFTTSKYKEYTQTAMEKASDPDVQEMIRLYSTQGLNDVSNSAMKYESVLRTSYQYGQTEDGKAALLAQLRKNPDLVESLSIEYESLVQTMQKFVPEKYEAYKRESREEFGTAYVRGRIDKDPHQALEMLKSGALGNELQYETVDGLIREANSEIKHREADSKRLERKEDNIHKQLVSERMTDIRYASTFGADNPWRMIEESYTDGTFTEQEKKEAEIWLHDHEKAKNKKEEVKSVLDDCVVNKIPAPLTVSAEAKNNHFYDYIDSVNQRREGAGKNPMSLVEMTEYAKNNSIVYDGNISRLKNSIVSSIRTSENPEKILDGCLALNGNDKEVSLKGVDEECVNFAWLAYDEYLSSEKSVEAVKKLRDEYFKDDKNMLEYNKKIWTEETKGKTMEEVLSPFFENYGFKTEEHWYGNKVSPINRDYLEREAYGRIKSLYLRTGSITRAESAAAKYIKDKIKPTDINGIDGQMMVNPPSGQTDYVLQNLVSMDLTEIIKRIEKNGDNYKGNIKVRIKESFFEKSPTRDNVFKEKLMKSNKKIIEAYINGSWEPRVLLIDSLGEAPDKYTCYILPNEDDYNYREYLINPKTGTRAIIDLSAKAIANFRGK
jgi:hypothetical protein